MKKNADSTPKRVNISAWPPSYRALYAKRAQPSKSQPPTWKILADPAIIEHAHCKTAVDDWDLLSRELDDMHFDITRIDQIDDT